MINKMEVHEDDEEFKNHVDLLFDKLAEEEPDHFAVRQYAKYKLAAGKTAKSILVSCGARLAVFDIAEVREVTAYDELELDNLTYTKVGDYYIPDITLGDVPDRPSGKYGRMRLRYLKEHRPVLYGVMSVDGTLAAHLAEIDEAAERRLEVLMTELAKSAGATEALKASDPMKWVGLMNTCKAQAEEIIYAELIYQ